MAFADWDAFVAAVQNPSITDRNLTVVGTNTNSVEESACFWQSWGSQYQVTPGVGGSSDYFPSTAVALDYTGSLGRYSLRHPTSGTARLVRADLTPVYTEADNGILGNAPKAILVDRLSHMGGLALNVTTSQTTNLPTAALTRYTDGVGVQIGVHVAATGGFTETLITASYTNQAGTAGRTATAAWYYTSICSFLQMTLEGSDTGARSVESVSLTPSTGGAGDFGVFLYKPLALIQGGLRVDATTIVGWNTPILAEAHLALHFSQRDGKTFTTNRDYNGQMVTLYFAEA